jgi:hypothetical protein
LSEAARVSSSVWLWKKSPMGGMRTAAPQQPLKTPLLFHGRPDSKCLQACRFAAEGVR